MIRHLVQLGMPLTKWVFVKSAPISKFTEKCLLAFYLPVRWSWDQGNSNEIPNPIALDIFQIQHRLLLLLSLKNCVYCNHLKFLKTTTQVKLFTGQLTPKKKNSRVWGLQVCLAFQQLETYCNQKRYHRRHEVFRRLIPWTKRQKVKPNARIFLINCSLTGKTFDFIDSLLFQFNILRLDPN